MLHLCRSFLLAMTIVVPLIAVDSITTDQQAQEATTVALADLKAGDNDPAKTVAAALEFTQLLDYYKEKGNTDQVCEMQANVYWCKKRMNLESLKAYVAAKGASAQALATRAEEIVNAEVPKDQAEAYFERAEKFSKEHATAQLAIAIRYFEVADRFTGTAVSLKAQRASLNAMQQSMVNSHGSDPTLSADLHAGAIAAGDLPEGAQKLIERSNQAVDMIVAKASQDLAQDRNKAVDILLKEAEAAQKRGDLDPMIAHQNQAANIDKEVPGLSKTANAAVDTYRKARAKSVTKSTGEVVAERKRLTLLLSQAQKEETKKGNTTGALAIKNAIGSISKEVDEAGAILAGGKGKQGNAGTLKERFGGSFGYDFKNGHIGTLSVQKTVAITDGFQGIVTYEADTAIISWNNGTKWVVSDQSGELVASAPDGKSKLITRGDETVFIGQYRVTTPEWGGVWTLQKDGKSTAEGITGTWTVDENGKVTIKWISGRTEYLQATKKGNITTYSCTLSSGIVGTAVRL
jgi:hypothetical protein